MKSAILLVGESDIQFARVVIVMNRYLLARGQPAAQFKVLPKRVEGPNPEKPGQSRYSYGRLPYTGCHPHWQSGKPPIPAPMWGYQRRLARPNHKMALRNRPGPYN